MKILDIPQSGKSGTMVSYRHGSVQCRRRLVIPHDPCSPAQMARRDSLKQAARLWGTLSGAQYAAWANTASGLRTHPHLNQSGPLPPYLLFEKINCNLAAIDQPMVLNPPPLPNWGENPVGELSLTNTNGPLALKLSVLGAFAGYVVVLGTKPRSPGTTYVDHFTILGLLPEPVGGQSDLTALFIAKYGPLPPGKRLFLEFVQQIDGWQSLPDRRSVQVPHPQS